MCYPPASVWWLIFPLSSCARVLSGKSSDSSLRDEFRFWRHSEETVSRKLKVKGRGAGGLASLMSYIYSSAPRFLSYMLRSTGWESACFCTFALVDEDGSILLICWSANYNSQSTYLCCSVSPPFLCVLVTQMCLTLCNTMNYSLPKLPPSMEFSSQEYSSGLHSTSRGSSQQRIEPWSA